MGLGKTVITIAAIEQLIEDGEVGGGLIIVPASLKFQWQRMIREFTHEEANILVVDGPPKRREEQYRVLRAGEAEYGIITYDQVVNDWEIVRSLPRDYIVIDEATAIKNFQPKRSKRVKRLSARFKWALTGQPIENRAEEVFSIMQWVDPDVLGSFDTFDKTFIIRDGFGRVLRYKNLDTLHNVLDKAMVRRTRDDVADQLPRVVEESILVDFYPAEAAVYRHIVTDLLVEIQQAMGWGNFNLYGFYSGADDMIEARGRVMSRLTCLRMLCDSPELLRRSADLYDGVVDVPGIRGGSEYASELKAQNLIGGLKGSPKLQATVELITEILEADPDNKIVLFSFFKHMLDLIEEATAAKTRSVKFTGSMNSQDRDISIQTFKSDPECRLFLSSDAGGYGVDLPQANFLISFDLPWSAGKWDQRNARIIRLSSTFPKVTLISMLMAGSIEERQYDMLQQKSRIGAAVMDGKGIDTKGGLSLTLDSLSEFLRLSQV